MSSINSFMISPDFIPSQANATSNEAQNVNTETGVPSANTEADSSEQVTTHQGTQGKNSAASPNKTDTTSTGTAAAGLQKGQGASASDSISSSQLFSNFTLKVDSTESTSSTSSTESTSSSYVDSNGAPKIPDPNVFEMVDESTDLSSQLQLLSVQDMVSANAGMNETLSKAYSTQIANINAYIKAQHSASNKPLMVKTITWITNIAMITAGVLTADPVLVAAGVAMCILTADPGITSGLTNALEKMGLPPMAANIMSSLIIVGAAMVGGMGIGAIGTEAAMAGSEAAVATLADSGTEATSAATTSASTAATTSASTAASASTEAAQSISLTETMTALSTEEGRTAFVQGAMRGASKAITNAPSRAATFVYNVPGKIATSTAALYEFASNCAEQCMALGSKGLFTTSAEAGAEASEAATATLSEQAIAQLQSMASTLSNMDPLKLIHITADLTMAALSTTGAVMNYNAATLRLVAEKAETQVSISQAQTTELTQQIQMANTQVQTILGDMNSAVINAGTVLSSMSELSAETLGQLHGAAA